MFDYIVLLFVVLFVWSILILATSGVVTLLEHIYCKCKPNYPFHDSFPGGIASVVFWPIILPLLLLELVYMVIYCSITNLRDSL